MMKMGNLNIGQSTITITQAINADIESTYKMWFSN